MQLPRGALVVGRCFRSVLAVPPSRAAACTFKLPLLPPTAAGWHRSGASLVPTSFRDAQDQIALSERQEAFLLERLPSDWTEDDINGCLMNAGVNLGKDWHENILIMRSRIGTSIGRALVASSDHVPNVRSVLPPGTTYRPMDRNDVELFVEQCERFVDLSEDLQRLAQPENFLRVITISEVPAAYGRQDIAYVIKKHCDVIIDPRDVVFRFKRWGRQADTCYVLCPTVRDANHCIAQIQELAVPKRAAYGTLFGATFLYSGRSTLFMSHPDLDYVLHGSPCWVFTTGWQKDITEEAFLAVIHTVRIFPVRVVQHYVPADDAVGFFMLFDTMDYTKRAFNRLRRLKYRWRMKRDTVFFAYPRVVDIHHAGDEKHADEDSASESEIDEPVHY